LAAPNGGLSATAVLHAAMLSDWHVGSGGGTPGYVDAHVRRDADGLPYLPGSTVTGVLRDACQTVAEALDEGEPAGVWRGWHRFLFGDQPAAEGPGSGRRIRAARVGIGPARLPAALRERLRADRALAAAATFVKPGVALDPLTGRAADGMLRFTEMARAGLPLEAAVTVDLPADPPGRLAASALLILGAAWCDRVGGDRRRGAGAVAFRFDDQEPAGWARWLAASGWVPPPAPAGLTTPADPGSPLVGVSGERRSPARRAALALAPVSPPAPAAVSPWTCVDLAVTTRLPVRVPADTTGNVVHGLDYLPGALLLPWLSDRWGAGVVRDAVSSGELIVRHAYPEHGGERSVPAPLALFALRGSVTVVNTAAAGMPAVPARQVRDRWTLPAPVAAPVGSAPDAPTGGASPPPGVLLAASELTVISHNQVSRGTQRVDATTGLFTVEAIPAGRTLRSSVLLGAAPLAAQQAAGGPGWASRLAGGARLGSRRRGEYGAVEVAVTPAGPPAAPATPGLGGVLRVWAVADVVVRSASLRQSADPVDVVEALRVALDGGGLRLELAEAPMVRTSRSDRWQTRWQLPRESVLGLAAGSVLTVRVAAGSVDPNRLAELAMTGLGERQPEGFGEVLLDAPLLGVREAIALAATPASPARDPAASGLPGPRTPADEQAGGAAESALSVASAQALAVLRREADVTAVRRQLAAGYLAAAPAGSLARRLATAVTALSPSQRGRWRALCADASLRSTTAALDAEVRRWIDHPVAGRRGQPAAAAVIAELLAAPDALAGLSGGGGSDNNRAARVDALAVLVDEIADGARRGRPLAGTAHEPPEVQR
jgi:CRISPR-associated protein Csx10